MKKITFLLLLFLIIVPKGYSQCDTPLSTLNEGFDGITAPNLPNCWSKIIRGSNISVNAKIITENNSNAFTSPNVVSLNNSTSSGAYDVILVSPQLSTATSDNYRLRFYSKCATANVMVEIGTLDKNSSDAVFTAIGNVTISQFYNEYKVNLNSHGSNAKYIGIRLASTTIASQIIYIDNIIWEPVPTCTDVSQQYVYSVSPNSANIKWTGDESINSYDIAVGDSSTNDPSSILTDKYYNTTNKTFTIPDLTSSTTYRAWIRSVCTTGGKGVWFGPLIFKTDCNPVTSINENFETTAAQTLPVCWSKILSGSALSPTASISTNTSNGYLSNNALQLSNQGSTLNGSYNIIAVTPNLSNVSTGQCRLKFYAKGGTSSGTLTLEIGTLNTNTNSATFNKIDQISLTGNTYSQQYIIDLTQYQIPQDQNYIGFRFSSSNPTFRAIFIDNVIWEIIPACADVTNIEFSNITSNEAKINWFPGDIETKWDISVRPASATEPDNVNFDSYTDTSSTSPKSFLKTGLDQNTDYKVWIRSVCQAGKGIWIGPATFKTACSVTANIDENFDTVTAPNLPQCWSTILKADSSISGSKMEGKIETISTISSVNSAPNGVYLRNFGSTNNYDIILATPGLTNLNLGTYRLKFYASGSQKNLALEIGTLTDKTDPSTFHKVTTVTIADDSTIHQSEYVIEFASYISNDKYIGFRFANSNDGYKSIYLDNIVWQLIPQCPDITGQKFDFATIDSAGFSWNKGSSSKWEVVYATADVTNPDSAISTLKETLQPSIVLDKLSSATTYNVWIRSVCDHNKGYWSKPVKFVTECDPVTSFNENFDTTPVFNLPICWYKIIRELVDDSQLGVIVSGPTNGATSKPNVLTLSCSGNNPSTTDIILVCPKILSSSLESNLLSFYANANSPVAIGILDKNTNDATFTELDTKNPSDTGAAKLFTVDLSGKYTGTATEVYIGIRLKTGITQSSAVYVSLDNLKWESKVPLASDKFDFNSLTYFPNPVKDVLNISNINNISAVAVFNLLGQEVISKSGNDNFAKIDMSTLSNGTYLVKVTSNNLTKTIKVIKE